MKNMTNSSLNLDMVLSQSESFFELDEILRQAINVVRFYIIPTIAGIGLITNVSFLIVLLNKRLKHRIYQDLWIKTFCDLIVCISSLGYINIGCRFCKKENIEYWKAVYDVRILYSAIIISATASTYAEIYLIINRCINLFKPSSKILHFKKVYIISVFYFFAIASALPTYFFIEIKKSENNFTSSYIVSGSDSLEIYIIIDATIHLVLPCVVLLIINIISIIQLRRLNVLSANIGSNNNQSRKKSQRRFTKALVISSFVFLIIKILYLALYVLFSLSDYSLEYDSVKVESNDKTIDYIDAFTVFSNTFYQTFNCFFYIYMDSNLREIIFL